MLKVEEEEPEEVFFMKGFYEEDAPLPQPVDNLQEVSR